MSEWTACAFGEIVFPPKAHAAWLGRSADPATYRDWPMKAMPDPAGVSMLVKEIAALGRRGNYVSLVSTSKRVTIRALFSGETDLWVQTIGLALREAAAVGGRGVVTFTGADELPMQPPLRGGVWRLEVESPRSRFRQLRGAEGNRVRADHALFATVMEIIEESLARPRARKR